MSYEKKQQGPIRKDVIINNLRFKTFISCIIISNKEMGWETWKYIYLKEVSWIITMNLNMVVAWTLDRATKTFYI
jgi:hypothetical protein